MGKLDKKRLKGIGLIKEFSRIGTLKTQISKRR